MSLQYHHCISLENVIFDEIKPNQKFSEDDLFKFFKESYLWLEKQIGFYPLFLAVGETEKDIRMTGYQNQFGRILTQSAKGNTYVKKGKFSNMILFSFDEVEGIFTDYDYWFFVLNTDHKNEQVSEHTQKILFKQSWNKSKWLLYAKRKPHSVQLATSKLDLKKANRIWCRNKDTKSLLDFMGFDNVEVKRLRSDKF